jgi:hypothetical protein
VDEDQLKQSAEKVLGEQSIYNQIIELRFQGKLKEMI